MSQSFFSVSVDLILKNEVLPYDLYINSAANVQKEKFIRIYPMGEKLSESELNTFKLKYHQLYIIEEQRGAYLKSLVPKVAQVPRNPSIDLERSRAIKESAIHYLGKLFEEGKEFTTEVLDEAIEGCRDSVESMVGVIKDYDITSLQEMIGKLSFHDFYTYDHSINVSMYNIAIYKSLKPQASQNELVAAGLGGLLHDLGKIKIPTSIINNPDKLSEEQFTLIKSHPEFGRELLQECDCHSEGVDFSVIERVVYEHHENYNGTGYPRKIGGEEIHLLARITAISDFFDALTTKRSYHEVMSTEQALNIMRHTVGKKIDPKLFAAFEMQIRKMEEDDVEDNKALPESFDPCQPHRELPLELIAESGPRKVVKKVVKKKVVKRKAA